jgi:hypothetical protein
MDEVNKLLKKPNREQLQPSNAIAQSDGFYGTHAKELLELLDGKRDNVTIGRYTMIVTKREDDAMYVRAKNEFVPCGWLTREWLRGKLAKTR